MQHEAKELKIDYDKLASMNAKNSYELFKKEMVQQAASSKKYLTK